MALSTPVTKKCPDFGYIRPATGAEPEVTAVTTYEPVYGSEAPDVGDLGWTVVAQLATVVCCCSCLCWLGKLSS